MTDEPKDELNEDLEDDPEEDLEEDLEDDPEEEPEDDPEREARIAAILGDSLDEDEDEDEDQGREKFYQHLLANLRLPCAVGGLEDFNWEEPYVFGSASEKQYEKLKKTQPSYQDVYDLLEIDDQTVSDWMISMDDLGAIVRRQSDGKEFVLGLSELITVDEDSPNAQLLEDYAFWFFNYR